jgi:hypothetical protein
MRIESGKSVALIESVERDLTIGGASIKRFLYVLAIVMLAAGTLLAQPRMGSVAGTVVLSGGDPAVGAQVHLSSVGMGPGHGPRFHAGQMTTASGSFMFPQVLIGAYTVDACLPMSGFAAAVIEVLPEQTTNVTLTLQPRDTSGHPRDSLTVIELQGTAIVITPDTLHPRLSRYFLDVDADGAPDYRLAFGPPWYNPPTGATRPQNGDQITIVGGLLGYAEPPMVVVFEINGLPWRDPRGGHGGYCGQHQFVMNECNGMQTLSNLSEQQNPPPIELMGSIEYTTCEPFPHNAAGVFWFLSFPDFRLYNLNFGTDMNAPPVAPGELFHIVGALVPSVDEGAPWVVPYEYNETFWREPGDTVNLASTSSAVDDPVPVGEATSHLLARNYPNPFNPVTTIQYSIPVGGTVELKVFDITGREIATLVSGYRQPGTYRVTWDGCDAPSGIYVYRLSAGGASFAGRMVLLK